MPRRARVVMAGMPHHVTQRGNYRQKVFEHFRDFQKYCYWAKEYAASYRVDILAYCLMTNHVHFIVVPKTSDGLAKFFNFLHMRYSQHKNLSKKQKGHLWQGRFYSSLLDESHLFRAIRYVEQNPVRAKIVQRAGDYVWSSARERLGLEKNPILKIAQMPGLGIQQINWAEFLGEEDRLTADLIRQKTQKGYVIGPEPFIAELESRLGVRLKERKVGRPLKQK